MTKRSISARRLSSSGARKIDDGWTVAVTRGASDESTNVPRCRDTLNDLPRSACAAVALALALAVWRVSILALALEALFLLALFLTRGLRTHHLIAFAPSLAAGLAASLAIPYLLAGPFLLSRAGALVFLTLGLLLADAATALLALRTRYR